MLGELVRAGGILTGATLITGLCGYVFQVLMARLLGDSYAVFGAFNALSMLLLSPLGAVAILVVRRVAAAVVHGAFGEVRRVYRGALAGVGLAGLAVCLLTAAFLPAIRAYLRAPDAASVWLVCVITILSAFEGINVAFLQGLKRFAWLGVIHPASVLVKIAAAVPCVAVLGWGLNGALFGWCVSALVAAVVGGAVVWAEVRGRDGSTPAPPSGPRFSARAILPVAVASLAISAMTQLDMVLVNHYFDPLAASRYAAASILGKIVLYLPGGVVTALLPLVSQRHARSESGAGELRQALLITGVVCGSAAIFFGLAGRRVVQAVYGPDLAEAGVLLQMYGFAMLPITIVMVVENFLMAQGRTLFAWLFLVACPLQVWAIHVWHPSLAAVIGVIGLLNTALVGVGLAIVGWRREMVQGTAASASAKMADQR